MTDLAIRPDEAAAAQPEPSRPSPATLLWVAGVGVLAAAGILLRFFAPAGLWLDEAQSVAIARLPLTGDGVTLVEGLRQDGSPPLYYLLLHFWIEVFGEGDRTVRLLSAVLNLACVPLVWLLARRVVGRPSAPIAVVLFLTSPFAIYFGSETRMYSLLLLFALLGGLALERTLRSPSPWSALGLSASAAAVALTHYWSLYLLVTVGVGLLAGALRLAPKQAEPGHTPVVTRRGCWWSLAALCTGGVFFLPWLPVFVHQLAHTGTPWGEPADLAALVHAFGEWAGGPTPAGRTLLILICALLAFAVFGTPAGPRHVLLDLKGREPGRSLFVLAIGTLVLAVAVGQVVGNAWADRYTATAFVPYVLCAALGVQQLSDRRLRQAAVLLVALFGVLAAVPEVRLVRTQAVEVAQALNAQARPGDVVLVCPDQLGPALARRPLPAGVSVHTVPTYAPPDRVDWTDYEERNRTASATGPALRAHVDAGVGSVWVVSNAEYRTNEVLCPALLDELLKVRTGTLVVGKRPAEAAYERAELHRFTPRVQ